MHEIFDKQAKEALDFAGREAKRLGHLYIGSEHILLGILNQEGIGSQTLKNFDLDTKQLVEKINEILDEGNEEAERTLGLTLRAKKILRLAKEYAARLNHDSIKTGHLLYGCATEGFGFSGTFLRNYVSVIELEKELTSLLTTGKSSLPSIILDTSGSPYTRE